MSITTVNPATGKPIKEYEEMPLNAVQAIIDKTHAVQLQWRDTTFTDRSKLMQAAAKVLDDNLDEYATIITTEMGKTITQARAEIKKCAWHCNYYAEHAEKYLKDQIIKTEMKKSYVHFRPFGVIYAIMPWNFPFWQVIRFAAPNLMAGNAAILKHAPISTGAAMALESIFKKAGFPEDLFRTIIVGNDVASKIIEQPHIAGVTLTGSDNTGRIVGAAAGHNLKKVVLELGGSDPYLILHDADLEYAAETCVTGRLHATGQVCISPKRLIIDSSVYKPFVDLVLAKAREFTYGDPMQTDTKMGPMARADLRDEVHHQVQSSIKNGAELLLGGEMPSGEGFYYPATVLANVKRGQAAYDEEIFGPVISLIQADSEAEAIALANDTRFGLGAGVYTKDVKRGEEIAANQLRAGAVAINTTVTSDPRMPFGGIKDSGIGREMAPPGIFEFMNIKTVSVK